MTDIVERLRHLAKLLGVGQFDIPARLDEAADEIERRDGALDAAYVQIENLRVLLSEAKALNTELRLYWIASEDQVERLNLTVTKLDSALTAQTIQVNRLRSVLESLTQDPPATLDEPDTDAEVIQKMRATASDALSPNNRFNPGREYPGSYGANSSGVSDMTKNRKSK